MAKQKIAAAKRDKRDRALAHVDPQASASWVSARTVRETIESVVVAFILAFLFRTFEAEAFVIPTGSMAPTLMGAHKDLDCPQCGYEYQAGASSEEEQMAEQTGRWHAGVPVEWATCPMCRYTAHVGPGSDYPTYGGDRILVSKFAYEFADPERWDIVVFKNPGEAETNFIKRCVGLPEETIRIYHGDLYVRPKGETQFALAERGPAELRAMAQVVYDNDYVDQRLTKAGWPQRWQAWPTSASNETTWQSDDGGRSFAIQPKKDEAWLRYRHFVPSFYDWKALRSGRLPADSRPEPLLVTDFYAYDTSISRGSSPPAPSMLGYHWVGDLLLELELESTDGQGSALFDLVKGGRHFRCEVNLETGEAQLAIDGLKDFAPRAQTGISGAGTYDVIFANVDQKLWLWVDGSLVEFDKSTEYGPLDHDLPQSRPDDPLDLAPAGVASRGAGLAVRHLRLLRDIYYIASDDARGGLTDYAGNRNPNSMNYASLYAFWSSPQLWSPPNEKSPFERRRAVEFPLAADQFFMLGDNSPASSDARLWDGEKFVARELLIGKALLIFWPHSFHRIPGTSIPLPFFPNFARMGPIR